PEELPLGGEASRVADDTLPLGDSIDQALDQALDLVTGEAAEPLADEPVRATTEDPAAPAAPSAEEVQPETEAERAKHRRPVQKKRGRASVPSWDEIMFGGGDQ
ncbi:septation protein SepH, partial [Nocardioides kongjuensis]